MKEEIKKKYDEAMKEMECWETQKHLKNCKKCQETIRQILTPNQLQKLKDAISILSQIIKTN